MIQSAAIYRTNDIKAIYMNAAAKAKMIEENIAALRKRQATVGTVAWKRAHSRMVEFKLLTFIRITFIIKRDENIRSNLHR